MSTSKRIGKYEIIALIARDEHAAVYRAEDGDTRQPVAVKILRRAAVKTEALGAFRKQSQTLARLDHPSIAACIDVVDNEAAFGLVSPLCEGKSVASLLKEGAHPEMRAVWDIVRPMLEALAAAHALGAPHRDLKPANLILAPNGEVRVTDFGVSALLQNPPNEVHYRAPEQFNDGQIGLRTDVYQAGAIVYQLVTGKQAFTGTPEEVAHRVFEERPSDPSSYNNRIAWQLDWVIQKAMSKDPMDRFPSASEFAEGLRLGLQETVGRPLDPIAVRTSSKPAAAAVVPARAVASDAPAPFEIAKAPPGSVKPAALASKPAAPVAVPKPAPVAAKPAAVPPKAAVAEKPEAPPLAAKPAAKAEPKLELTLEPRPDLAAPAAEAEPVPAKAEVPKPAATPPAPPAPATPAPATPAPAAPAPAAPQAAEPDKVRVLFVDDDERILNAVRAIFRQDYEVLTATSGESALQLVSAGGVHVVISDQRMPGVTGVELLRKVRTLAPNSVRMLLTGYADLASLVGSINEGEIFRFVKKPWDNAELRKDVADAVKVALERAATAPPPEASAAAARTAGSILVIDPKDGLAKGLERLLAGTAQVIQVTNPPEAVKALAATEIAVIVADLGAGMDGLVALFKNVKAKRPNIHTILLADEPDSDLGIELINKAQIFRFLPKPVSAKDLRHQVSEALRRYATAKDSAVTQDTGHGGAANSPPVARSA